MLVMWGMWKKNQESERKALPWTRHGGGDVDEG